MSKKKDTVFGARARDTIVKPTWTNISVTQSIHAGTRQKRDLTVQFSLVNNPAVVFADEPSGNLDMTNSRALHELIWAMVKEKNQSFVIVTHNRELARQADRIIELYDGKIKV